MCGNPNPARQTLSVSRDKQSLQSASKKIHGITRKLKHEVKRDFYLKKESYIMMTGRYTLNQLLTSFSDILFTPRED